MTFKRISRGLLITLLVLAILACAGIGAFYKVGRWLVDPDPLQRAQAIVVLSGKSPFRAMQAADLYRRGWAPAVWLLEDKTDEADLAFARLGIPYPQELDYDQQVLEKCGVPNQAIRVLGPPTTNTVSEVTLIADELRRQNLESVILVTSPVHTRRVKAIWRIVVGEHPQAILRQDSFETYDPDHWWRATQDAESVVHELLGLVNIHLGFVAKPRK